MRYRTKHRIKVLLLIAAPLLLLALLISYCSRSCEHRGEPGFTDDMIDTITPVEPTYFYGICIDSMFVEEGQITQGQTLSTIFASKGIGSKVTDHIARNHKDVFDVGKIRSGKRYYFLISNDTLETPLFWIYEIDRRNYALFSLTDSLTAWRFQKDMEVQLARTSGVINTSLWNAVIDNGGDASLAVHLSDVYAWTIDFFGIQKGDCFDVVYDRQYIDGQPVGMGEVIYCEFVHCGDTLRAIAYEQDGITSFYNEKGENLRKAFLKAPLNYRRISSTFSNSRYHPVLKVYRPHHGVDYAAPAGTPVSSIGDGVVIKKAYQSGGAGYYLKIKHNSTYTTSYMHLKGYAKGIAEGVRVKQGQVIGYVGSTGISTGPHLDFRVFKDGTPIDPLKMESPPADPIKKEDMEQFTKVARYWMESMRSPEVPEPYQEPEPQQDSLAVQLNPPA
ncbi:MAG: peptidoglycan DD-metalloendopeptidase family protein [Bacteroidales bacterium]|nr:peptidoglycan DD-metalloendopeptidase family protein [Bacteroidales bacterium]